MELDIFADVVGGPFCGLKVKLGESGFKQEIVFAHGNSLYTYSLRENKELSEESFYDHIKTVRIE